MLVQVLRADAVVLALHQAAQAKALLKAGLKRRVVTYADLGERLAAIGIQETEPSLRNKLSRGKFSGAFLLACLESIGSRELRLD